MPTIPLRQRLLNSVRRYAQRLQILRRRELQPESDSDTSDTSISESEDEFRRANGSEDSDLSSLSSLSSISSLSSLSSLDSEDVSDPGAHNQGYDSLSSDGMSSDEEIDAIYERKLAAVRAHIKYLTETRVLKPNRVHKLSQLYLVLVLYKKHDPKRFRKNLRVAPETFDRLLDKVAHDPVFVGTGSHEQIPVEEQLAIALYRFGHFGNAASVEAIGQWAGVSAGAVVNCTRRVMQAILALHDDVVFSRH